MYRGPVSGFFGPTSRSSALFLLEKPDYELESIFLGFFLIETLQDS